MRLLGNLAGLGSLYLVQGIVAGIGLVLVQQVQAAGGSIEEQASLLAWGGLPWVLKLLWGFLLDVVVPPGSRRHHALLFGSQLVTAGGVFWVGTRVGTDELARVWFVLNLLASVQDVAADAFAIDAVEPAHRGAANAVMAGSRAFGAGFLGTMLIGELIGARGLDGALHVLGWICVAATLPVALVRVAARPRPARVGWPEFARSWVDRRVATGAALAVGILLADACTGAVAWEFLATRAGWSPSDALEVLMPWAAAAELLGFGLAIVVVDQVGASRTVSISAAILAAAWTAFGVLPSLWPSHAAVLTLTGIESLARAAMLVGVYSVLMAASAPRFRATHFVVFMALINLGRVIGPAVGPPVVAAVDFGGLYVLAGVWQGLMACFAARWVTKPQRG